MRPRVGHIQFLNSLPLYHMLVKNGTVLDIDLCKDTPVELCNRLLAGKLDISPVPAIEYARHADELLLLPDIAIASDGPVKSIVVVCKAPLERLDGKPFALTNTSRTSQVLTKIIMREHFGIRPRFFACPPDLPEMFREADAALLIGDDALRVYACPGPYTIYDLGEAWKALTGEKMVYAVWAVRKDYERQHPEKAAAVQEMFQRSAAMSRDAVSDIARDIARWEPFSETFLEGYFKTLKFSLDEGCQRGLLTYYHKARELGEIDGVPALRFIDAGKGCGEHHGG